MHTASDPCCYCVDTNIFISMTRFYPRDIFSSLWNSFEALANNKQIISPKEVYKELEAHGDKENENLRWAKRHKHIFIDLDTVQLEAVKEILKRFPTLVDHQKITPDADPFLISLAKARQAILVTEEKLSTSTRPKIPNVCSADGIRCLTLHDFFRAENWQF